MQALGGIQKCIHSKRAAADRAAIGTGKYDVYRSDKFKTGIN